jgi:site-specific recombinase XerD
MNASEVKKRKMDTTLDDLVEIYITTKRIEAKSPQTLIWYRNRLKVYSAFLGPTPPLKHLTLVTAREFIGHLQTRTTRYESHPLTPTRQGGLSPATVHGYVRTLKAFSHWLCDEGFIPVDVLQKLKRPKVPQTLIEVLSDQEVDRILSDVNQNCVIGARMYAIFMLLLDTGIRADELCTLTLENTNIEQNFIKVFGKGSKERRVNFGGSTKKALMRYITLWRPQTEAKTLFLTNEGTPLTYSALAQIIQRTGRRQGIPRLHLHLFRHTFAVRFLTNGGDLITLKTLMGHSDIVVTQVYLRLTQQNIADVYSRNSPMDRYYAGKKR